MQEEIKKIEIVLENCEVITVEGKHIGEFGCNDISYSINRIACNSINEMYTCKDFHISIHKDAALDDNLEYTMGIIDEKRNPLKRIHNYSDITSIYIYSTKDEDNPRQFFVEWDGGEYDNDNQKTHMNKFGDLFIVISKNTKLNDVFNMEEIEDQDHMNFIWSMYS